jgi:hypothetical protein
MIILASVSGDGVEDAVVAVDSTVVVVVLVL